MIAVGKKFCPLVEAGSNLVEHDVVLLKQTEPALASCRVVGLCPANNFPCDVVWCSKTFQLPDVIA